MPSGAGSGRTEAGVPSSSRPRPGRGRLPSTGSNPVSPTHVLIVGSVVPRQEQVAKPSECRVVQQQLVESVPLEHFKGTVRVQRLFQASDPARASGAWVTFDPGARTAWHAHPLGQTLVVSAGTGWVQRRAQSAGNPIFARRAAYRPSPRMFRSRAFPLMLRMARREKPRPPRSDTARSSHAKDSSRSPRHA